MAADSHDRFLVDLELLDAGFLSREEEANLAAHLRDCTSCREAAADRDEDELPITGHVPPAMLARWDRVRTLAAGLERELLARHLDSCPECRQELELIGHTPTLEGSASDRPEVPGRQVSAEPSISPEAPQVHRLPPWPHRWRVWAQGALAGAALSAAAATVVILRSTPQQDTSHAVPWVVPGTIRGSAPVIQVPSGTRRVLLAIPVPPELSTDEAVRLTVTGPGDSSLMEEDLNPTLLGSPTLMTVLTTTAPLETGVYTVRLSNPGSEPVVTSFRLSISNH